MTSDPQTLDSYAVVGHPIDHSLSPLIHRHFAVAANQSLTYDLLAAPADGFAEAATAFFAAGGAGLNVTLPFKEEAQKFVARCDPAAGLAGAVNTIRRASDGTLEGFNTDGIGLVRDVQENLGWPLTHARVLLIGAGGASRGVLDALLAESPKSVTLANRTLARAEALVADVAPEDERVSISAPAELSGNFDLVINATSASLAGQSALVPTESVAGACCYDMLYSPQQTVFSGWALSHGASAVSDGLGMLLEQAAEAFYLWRQVRPEIGELLAQRSALFAAKQADALSLQEFLAATSGQRGGVEQPELESAASSATTSATALATAVKRPRFIAGAVCPECREVDRIVVREGALGREQACTACGYSQPETKTVNSNTSTMIPRGKPERSSRPKPEVRAEPVRFIDPLTSPSHEGSQGSSKRSEKNDNETD